MRIGRLFTILVLWPFVAFPTQFTLIQNVSLHTPPPRLYRCEHGKLTMSSTAPLETIRAGSNQLKGAFDLESHTFAWSVDVKTIAGFNSSLQQEHFNENYMESAKYPKAVFTGKIIEKIPLEQDGIYMVRAKGMLEAHGVARERIIKVKLEIKKQNISIHSDFTINLSEHNIAIPRVVHQKISDLVHIQVDANLIPAS